MRVLSLGRLSTWFWSRAPRQLSVTKEGRALIGISLAAGLAAINTGNNLLFLGWGMTLSAIVVSGVLSEATLRVLRVRTAPPPLGRAGEPSSLPVDIINESVRFPAFALQIELQVESSQGSIEVPGPWLLRLNPAARSSERATFTPTRRGMYRLERLRAHTRYPFGFFQKSRRFRPQREVCFWVAPRAVDVQNHVAELFASMGDESAPRIGGGDEFFSLRPFRFGDDPRHIHARRSAKVGRFLVVEHEAMATRQVRLELDLFGVGAEAAERAIEVLGSLSERLLEAGLRVGIRAPGVALEPSGGPRQRWVILHALARLDLSASLPTARATQAVAVHRVAIVPRGGRVPVGVHAVVPTA